MEILLGLLCLGFVAFGVIGLLMLGGVGLMGKRADKYRAEAVANKDEILADTFNGKRVITYRINRETMPAEMVIEGADEYGYDLTSRTVITEGGEASDLVFTKRA